MFLTSVTQLNSLVKVVGSLVAFLFSFSLHHRQITFSDLVYAFSIGIFAIKLVQDTTFITEVIE